jgi:mannose-6-phosphate isomerase
MNKICILKNPTQEYAWGSKTVIQALLGQAESKDKPIAELWMGDHPKAASNALIEGEWQSLDEVIKRSPESILGKDAAKRFSNRLPFLFKVLAVDSPLSIQVHPNLEQARAGFARENSLKIPLNAPNRNYKDENHKPEILCALTPFQGLKGFRKIEEILALMEKIASSSLSEELDRLKMEANTIGLKGFFTTLMRMDRPRQSLVVSEAVRLAEKLANEDQAFYWMVELNKAYPGDIGVFSPVILNLVQLEPGEAIYLPAGELHAYLCGVGVELMANSDNVLRGGLTSKHIDVIELLKIVNFKTGPVKIIKPEKHGMIERTYPTPAEEFLLSKLSVDEGGVFASPQDRSVEILICLKGKADVKDLGNSELLRLDKGKSIIVPAAVSQYQIEGNTTFYKASVPL